MSKPRHTQHTVCDGCPRAVDAVLLLLVCVLVCDTRAVADAHNHLPRLQPDTDLQGAPLVRHVEIPVGRSRKGRGNFMPPLLQPVLHPFVYGLMDGFMETTAEAVVSEDTYGYGRPKSAAAAPPWSPAAVHAADERANTYFRRPFQSPSQYNPSRPDKRASEEVYGEVDKEMGRRLAEENYYQDKLRDLIRPADYDTYTPTGDHEPPRQKPYAKGAIGLPGYYHRQYADSSVSTSNSQASGSTDDSLSSSASRGDSHAPGASGQEYVASGPPYIDVAKTKGAYAGYRDYNAEHQVDTRELYSPAEYASSPAYDKANDAQSFDPAAAGYGNAVNVPPDPGWTAERLYRLVAETIILSWILDR